MADVGARTYPSYGKVAGKPNFVRGFLSGTIGKKLGTPVESFQSTDSERSYQISSK